MKILALLTLLISIVYNSKNAGDIGSITFTGEIKPAITMVVESLEEDNSYLVMIHGSNFNEKISERYMVFTETPKFSWDGDLIASGIVFNLNTREAYVSLSNHPLFKKD